MQHESLSTSQWRITLFIFSKQIFIIGCSDIFPHCIECDEEKSFCLHCIQDYELFKGECKI